MFIAPSEISQIHLELTEKCNAACPICLRTESRGLHPKPYIGKQELTLPDIKRFFTPTIRDQLQEVHMCGSYGDPIMARDCLEIARYFSTEKCEVSISTNGSARGVKWWAELGRVLCKSRNSRVDFHIDGLADTNSFYRRNTHFDKIIDNARAYIHSGGRANWEFIPFKHNEHQLEEARKLSISLGFHRFTVKKSNWMFSKGKTKIPFSTASGKQYYLEAPSDSQRPKPLKDRPQDVFSGPATKSIQCLARQNKEIYVSCEGIVYPCCWTARYGRDIYLDRKTVDGFSTLFKQHDGRRHFNIRTHSLEQILQSDFFAQLAKKWKNREPAVCYRKCWKRDQAEKIKIDNRQTI